MKIKHFLLLVGLGYFAGAHAQSGVDTSMMMMDSSQAKPVKSAGATRRVGAQGPISVSLPKAKKDSLIRNIRAIFQRINSDTTLRVVGLDEEAFEEAVGEAPDNGGDAKGYYKNDSLYKLVLSVGPSFGMRDYEYYYDGGQLVFVYEKDRHYGVKKDGTLDHEGLVVGFEGRFYFNKGKLIAKVLKRNDQFMAEDIDDAYIRELMDVSMFTSALRKQINKEK